MLRDSEHFEQVVESAESGAISILGQRADTVGFEDVEGEAAQAGEHARVGSNARAVFAHGDVAAVVGSGLDPPMAANGLGGASGGDRGVRDVERGFSRLVQQPGLGDTGEDIALDTDDGGDVGMPVCVSQFAGGIEDGDGAAFVAVACLVVAVRGLDRGGSLGDVLDLLAQSGLVVLDLDDQGDVGFSGDLEVFF